MTVSVRPWDQIAADLRRWNMVLTREAADVGDALAAENAKLRDEWQTLCRVAHASALFQGGAGDRDPVVGLLNALEMGRDASDESDRLTAVVAAVHTALVRGYAEVAADLYAITDGNGWPAVAYEAAALLAGVAATLPTCPVCRGTEEIDALAPVHMWDEYGVSDEVVHGLLVVDDCPDCDHGKVTVAQMVALWDAVHGPDFEGDGSYPHTDDFLARLRSVPSPSPKGAT